MGRPLPGNTQVHASPLPFHTMALDRAVRVPFIGYQVSQFVQHGLLHFGIGNQRQLRIDLDQPCWPERPARARAHPGIPLH